MPRVTVLMCVLDGQRFLDEAMASVLSQDYDDFELLIVDDGSTDSTPAILRKWAAADSRVVVLRNETNLGISRAANIGLAAARGTYVARLDADDICMPGRLRAQVEVLDGERDVVLVSTGYEVVDEHGRRMHVEMRVAPHSVTAHLLHFGNSIGGHSQVMYRRDEVVGIGGYDEALEVCVDYDLWSRLVHLGRFVVLPIIGMKYRLHAARISVRKRDRQRETGRSITWRMLDGLYGRPLTVEEKLALASVWRQDCTIGVAARAEGLLREGYARFCATDSVGRNRRAVRIATARRWTIAAIALVRRGELRESASYLAHGLAWHPLGVVKAVVKTALGLLTRAKQRDAAGLSLGQSIEKA